MTPEQYCQDKAAQSGSSFYYSFLFLPKEQRRAITALYAFCREVDDVVDECSDASLASAKLAWWRTEIAALFHGSPQHPVAQALIPAIRKIDLPESRFNEIIDGMEMDLIKVRYASFDELSLYCHRVAGVVGLMAAEIFGRTKPETLEYAENLGTAFQLTNIIRDVGEDAQRNRIYFPQDELANFNVDPADILNARNSSEFRTFLQFQIARAHDYYARALAALPASDRRAQRPGLIMAGIYQALLRRIETQTKTRRDDILKSRTAMTPIRKLWIAWRTWLTA